MRNIHINDKTDKTMEQGGNKPNLVYSPVPVLRMVDLYASHA